MIGFWANTEEEEFAVTKYDEFLCKQKVVNKQTCHDYLTRDIRYILEHFSDNAKLLNHIKSLQKELKDVRKIESNIVFWSDIAPRLMKINYEKPTAEAELMIAGMRKAANLINTSISSKHVIESPRETRNKKKQKTKASQDMERVEYDGIYVGENDISVGTIIKRAALQYFHESKTRKLNARERKIMT